jgi:hypothetical protein
MHQQGGYSSMAARSRIVFDWLITCGSACKTPYMTVETSTSGRWHTTQTRGQCKLTTGCSLCAFEKPYTINASPRFVTGFLSHTRRTGRCLVAIASRHTRLYLHCTSPLKRHTGSRSMFLNALILLPFAHELKASQDHHTSTTAGHHHHYS